jgi:carbon monoxide dehydrogenase subunit G
VPSARRTRIIAAQPGDLWELICDPHHLPRWWPRVERVEDVERDEFTKLLRTTKGKAVRADFRRVHADEAAGVLVWEQQLEGSPFARVFASSQTVVTLEPAGAGTSVTIELHQRLNGVSARFGSFMVRRAAAATIEEALDGLERISG